MVVCFWLVGAGIGGSPLMILQKMQGVAIVSFWLCSGGLIGNLKACLEVLWDNFWNWSWVEVRDPAAVHGIILR